MGRCKVGGERLLSFFSKSSIRLSREAPLSDKHTLYLSLSLCTEILHYLFLAPLTEGILS